jgi:hypothetical protein
MLACIKQKKKKPPDIYDSVISAVRPTTNMLNPIMLAYRPPFLPRNDLVPSERARVNRRSHLVIPGALFTRLLPSSGFFFSNVFWLVWLVISHGTKSVAGLASVVREMTRMEAKGKNSLYRDVLLLALCHVQRLFNIRCLSGHRSLCCDCGFQTL